MKNYFQTTRESLWANENLVSTYNVWNFDILYDNTEVRASRDGDGDMSG